MVGTFQDGHDELYHHAKFGDIEQCKLAVGAKIWCLYFCFFFVTLRGQRAVRSRGYNLSRFCVAVYGSILMKFSAIFFRRDCPFRWARQFSFLLIDGATIFGKLWPKIGKSSKIGGKLCAHHFVQISERFKKNPPQYFRAWNVDVHLYKIFFCNSLYSAGSNCQILHRESKNGLERTSLCAPKVIQEVNFPKYFLQLCTGGSVVVHLYYSFSLWHQMVPQQSTKFRTTFFDQFCTSLRKDSIASYAWMWTLFTPPVRELDVLRSALNISQFPRQVAPQDSQHCS